MRLHRTPYHLAAVFLFAACGAHAAAEEAADRLQLQALIDEAGLIVEEAAQLRPEAERLAAEGAQLDAADKALRAEQLALNEEIVRFNARNVELDRQLQEHRARCPSDTTAEALVGACNERATQFNAAAREHEAQRPLLQERQRELPKRIDAHNAARRAWVQRKHLLDPKVQANVGDAEYWLASARTFLASDAFAALASKAREPAVCRAQALGDLNGSPATAAVERAYACLIAVAGAGG